MVEIIFSDIDGTLINDDYQVTPKTQDWIRKAVQEGLCFVPVSARMPEAIRPIISSMGLEMPIISYNGALIQDEHQKIIVSQTLSSQIATDICLFVEDTTPTIAWNVYSYGRWLAQAKENFWIEREIGIVHVQPERVEVSAVQELDAVHKLLLMGEPERIAPLERELKNRYPQLSITKSAPFFIEIMAQGIVKSQAVAVWADYLQVDLSETIAFGDNYNDLEMLEAVGKGYVMGNAPQEVQEKIGAVTADNNHDGIAEVLEKIL